MKESKHRFLSMVRRRDFISNTIKLTVFGSLLAPLHQSCNNNKTSQPIDPEKPKKLKQTTSNKNRNKWNRESLVINTKTNVIHFPTSKMYVYYDEILPDHLKEISLASWATQLQEPVKLHKEQSGNILEILTMHQLSNGIKDESLTVATETLAKAFVPACNNAKGINSNTTNFRLHELMLQLIALNNGVVNTDKWMVFNNKIKKPPILRKRQKWMENENNFNQRVNYILERKDDYLARLTKRASKYSFT